MATYTGWGLRAAAFAGDDLCDLAGQKIDFRQTKAPLLALLAFNAVLLRRLSPASFAGLVLGGEPNPTAVKERETTEHRALGESLRASKPCRKDSRAARRTQSDPDANRPLSACRDGACGAP